MHAEDFAASIRQVLQDVGYLKERQRCRAAFAPSLAYGRHFGPALPGARAAAVMAMIEIDLARPWRDWTIPLTVRPDHLAHHPGQISLPGGSLENQESPEAAAVRELQEELGLEIFQGEVVGVLQSLYIYNSNFQITPFVAVSQRVVEFTPCSNEVERLIHLPLGAMLNTLGSIERMRFERGGRTWIAPFIRAGADPIWGATAILLGELAAVIARATK